MKLVQLAATVALLAATTVACGGSPSDASKDDFCGALDGVATAYSQVDPEKPTEDQVKGVKEAVADLADIGTPDGISQDARAGFELITDEIGGLDDGVDAEELQKAGDDFSGDERGQADAFNAYVVDTCAPASGDDSTGGGQ